MANFVQKDFIKRQLVTKNELKRLEYKSIIKIKN